MTKGLKLFLLNQKQFTEINGLQIVPSVLLNINYRGCTCLFRDRKHILQNRVTHKTTLFRDSTTERMYTVCIVVLKDSQRQRIQISKKLHCYVNFWPATYGSLLSFCTLGPDCVTFQEKIGCNVITSCCGGQQMPTCNLCFTYT